MSKAQRNRLHGSSLAARAHRASGVALALFLPIHFWVLGRSLTNAAALEATLAWTSQPAVKFAEWGLVVLLALHLALGLRVLALEFLPWQRRQRALGVAAVAAALFAGLCFAWSVTAP